MYFHLPGVFIIIIGYLFCCWLFCYNLGIASVDSNPLSKGCCIKKYFTKTTAKLTLEEVRNSITYVREQYTGSNWDLKCDDATVEFELFLANLSSGRFKGIELKDFMLFSSGYDKIPSFGKKRKLRYFLLMMENCQERLPVDCLCKCVYLTLKIILLMPLNTGKVMVCFKLLFKIRWY